MFVTRARFDAVQRDLNAVITATAFTRDTLATQLRDCEREKAAAVTRANLAESRYHALAEKLAASIPEPKPSKLPERKGNRIQEVIADVAGSNAPLRKQLGTFARKQARDGVDEDSIVHALMHWQAEDDDE